MNATKKEIEKKMLIKKTINEMNKQIEKLEAQKKTYIEAGKQANEHGLTAQYNLALAGLRMTVMQQRRVREMKLNFEITAQMKDMTAMTGEFLKGMSVLSKDMMKLTREKEFTKVKKQFDGAMANAGTQMERMEQMMNSTESAFSTQTGGEDEEISALAGLMTPDEPHDSQEDVDTAALIDQELENLRKQMAGM